MPDENKEVTATETEEVNADAEVSEEESTEEVEESEEGASHPDNKIDHEAELKREREAREKAERALADKRFKFADKKRKEEADETGTEDDEDRPLTARELQQILAEERQSTQAAITEQKASEYANHLTTDPAEIDHLMDIYRNRSFPEYLSVQDRVEESYAIANRKRLIGERNEALRALSSKGRVKNDSATTYRDPIKGTEPKMSSQDTQAIKEAGFKWNGTGKRYEKKLQNGQTLVRDPQTGKTFIQ